MVKVIFVRHGQTEWNTSGRYQGQSDVPLSAEGLEQAQKLAAGFDFSDVTAIYASDLTRAMQTARAVGDSIGLTVHAESAFRELHFGDWEGLTYDEIVNGWPDAMENFLLHPDVLIVPHGESFHIVQERAMRRLNELIEQHEGETIAIFAHGAVLRTMLTAALHMPLEFLWSIRQFNTAVNVVRYDKGANPTVELLNSTAHLSASAFRAD